MSTTLPSLSKNPNAEEIQNYLNALALELQQKSQAEMKKISDQKGDVLAATATITDDLIASLFQKVSPDALGQIGTYLMSHPEAIATASTASVGAPPNPITVGVLGLMMLVMSSTTGSSIATTASENLEGFLKTYSKNG